MTKWKQPLESVIFAWNSNSSCVSNTVGRITPEQAITRLTAPIWILEDQSDILPNDVSSGEAVWISSFALGGRVVFQFRA